MLMSSTALILTTLPQLSLMWVIQSRPNRLGPVPGMILSKRSFFWSSYSTVTIHTSFGLNHFPSVSSQNQIRFLKHWFHLGMTQFLIFMFVHQACRSTSVYLKHFMNTIRLKFTVVCSRLGSIWITGGICFLI